MGSQQNSMWNNQDDRHDGMDHEGQYTGCYQSQDLESFTFGMKLGGMDHSCQYHCQQEQASYYYEMGDSCYCGPSSWVSKYGKQDDSQCSSQCYQSNAPNCGVKVYSTSDMKQDNKMSHSDSHTEGSWSYYGCFANQELNNFQFMYQEQSMSYEKCLGSCHDKQFTYSYIQDSACFCGSSEWAFEQNQNDECINGNRVYKWSTGKIYSNNMNSFLNDFIASTVKNFIDQGVDVGNSQYGNWNNLLGSFNNMFGNFNHDNQNSMGSEIQGGNQNSNRWINGLMNNMFSTNNRDSTNDYNKNSMGYNNQENENTNDGNSNNLLGGLFNINWGDMLRNLGTLGNSDDLGNMFRNMLGNNQNQYGNNQYGNMDNNNYNKNMWQNNNDNWNRNNNMYNKNWQQQNNNKYDSNLQGSNQNMNYNNYQQNNQNMYNNNNWERNNQNMYNNNEYQQNNQNKYNRNNQNMYSNNWQQENQNMYKNKDWQGNDQNMYNNNWQQENQNMYSNNWQQENQNMNDNKNMYNNNYNNMYNNNNWMGNNYQQPKVNNYNSNTNAGDNVSSGYGRWQKQGRCVGGRQMYKRFCQQPGQCNPAVRTTKYEPCVTRQGSNY